MDKSIDEPIFVKTRKIQAEVWDPRDALFAHAVESGSDALDRFYRDENELDAAIWEHERRFSEAQLSKEKGNDGVIACKEAVALAERIRDLYLPEGFDGHSDYIAFLAGRCLTLKEGRATGKVYTAFASLEVVNISECRGRWWPVHLAIPAELRVAFGVQTSAWLRRRCEDVARELARPDSPPDSPASRMFDAIFDGGFALITGLREHPDPIPVVLAPHEDTIKDYIQCAASSPDHRVDYWDALEKAAAMLLRSQQPLGEALGDWKARELDGQTKRPDGRKFAKRPRNALRNFAINKVIDVLERCGLPPTRNNASEPNSACDAVAEAFNLSYKTIETVWGDARRRHEQTKTPS